MITTTLTAIAGLIAAAYIGYAVVKSKGTPDSISATAYAVKYKKTFTAAMCGTAALLLPGLLEKTSEPTQFLPFLAIVGLLMVGLSPNYKTEGAVQHYTGAFLAAVGSQLTLALNDPNYLAAWVTYPLLVLLDKGKNSVFWAEIICFVNMFLYALL